VDGLGEHPALLLLLQGEANERPLQIRPAPAPGHRQSVRIAPVSMPFFTAAVRPETPSLL
jgi:hypothetical protein